MTILYLGVVLLLCARVLMFFARGVRTEDLFARTIFVSFKYVVQPIGIVLIPVGIVLAITR